MVNTGRCVMSMDQWLWSHLASAKQEQIVWASKSIWARAILNSAKPIYLLSSGRRCLQSKRPQRDDGHVCNAKEDECCEAETRHYNTLARRQWNGSVVSSLNQQVESEMNVRLTFRDGEKLLDHLQKHRAMTDCIQTVLLISQNCWRI